MRRCVQRRRNGLRSAEREAIEALLDPLPELLAVEGAELALIAHGDAVSVGVSLDRWKAPSLQRELLDRVHDEAERRARAASPAELATRRRDEVDRTLRAHVLVAWSRHSRKVVFGGFALAAWLGWHPLGHGEWADGAVVVLGGLVLGITLNWLVDRWHRRSERAEVRAGGP